MAMRLYFNFTESAVFKNRFIIGVDMADVLEKVFPKGTKGSYALLPARILGLSATEYLRFCRDRLGAELVGKGKQYVTPYFKKTQEAQLFLELLNKRMEYLLREKKCPFEFKEEINEKGQRVIVRIPLREKEENK